MIFRSAKMFRLLIVLAVVSACHAKNPSFVSSNYPMRPAYPSPKITCDLDGVEMFESLLSMPFQVIDALLESFKHERPVTFVLIAERDAAWNADDAIDIRLANRRFIAGMRQKNRWMIWYEQGARFAGPRTVFVAYDVSPSSSQPTHLESGDFGYSDGFAGLCQTTARVLRTAFKPDADANPTAR